VAPPSLPSLGSVTGIPADAVAALRRLPEIADNTRAMKEHTAALERVAEALDRVAADTAALPTMREDIKRVGELPEILDRLEGGIDRLDKGIDQLSELMERILAGIDGLNSSVETLQSAVGPLGRLAGRVPGQKKG
jgi:methyl-accepting chemotaxis protein